MLRIRELNDKKIVFLGDCITHDGGYCNFTEAYIVRNFLTECNATFINLGLNAETVSGLSEEKHPFKRPCLKDRLDRILAEIKPDYVFFMYGLNDGVYAKFDEGRFNAFKAGVLDAVEKINASGARMIIMTPTPFDNRSFMGEMSGEDEESCSYFMPYKYYNDTLKKYSEWLKTLSGKVCRVIDIFGKTCDYIHARYMANPQYSSGDGIHPNYVIHWLIACEILKSMLNITVTRVPNYVENPSTNEVFLLLWKNNKMLSDSWREYIGHDNIQKAKALPLAEAQDAYASTRETVSELIQAAPKPVEVSNYHGYKRYDFNINGRECILIEPKTPKGGGEWIWRTEFFGEFDYADRALLEQGYYVGYCRLSDMYGCPYAVKKMEKFRQFLAFKFKLNEKPVLFGFSRGGLYAVNYALKYHYNISAIYLDAPVLDLKSWPYKNNKKEWNEALDAYGMTEKEMLEFKGNPLDNAEKLAEYGVPLLMIAGDADDVVPYGENGEPFIKRFNAAGGSAEVIIKSGCGHHPHSLENPQPIVDFVEKYL